ncbi:MAG: hypothetical protein KAR42_05355 [candidate division Zixibacteria bacterium]|nr:hypothetical protein [candidate division Zixibacteria bacterium]
MLSSIVGFLGDNIVSLAGGVWAFVGVAVSFFAKKYLVPLLRVERKRRYARWIAAIADELTDDLKLKYPGRKWLQELDRAVDKIIEICGIERDIADRAIKASVSRKDG